MALLDSVLSAKLSGTNSMKIMLFIVQRISISDYFLKKFIMDPMSLSLTILLLKWI